MGPEGAIFGPYRVLKRLGGGAAGDMYLAESASTSPTSGTDGPQQIAIKILSGSAQDAAVQEIARQAQAAGQLHQPHIIPFHGIVQHAGKLGVAMAYAPGGSLGDALTRVGTDGARKLPLPLSNGIVGRLVSQTARALMAAHDAGLTHGDLKPNNIFVRTSPGGHPLAVLSDFGQAVLTGAAAALVARDVAPQQPVNTEGWPTGQLRFAAPEQLRGETTPASDQYALAALAYYLLTGAPPITADGPGLLAAIARQEIVAPTLRNAEVPQEIDAVLLRGLAKDPASRFANISLFAQALDEALAVGASVGGTSMTQQFSRLAGSTSGMPSPTAQLATVAPGESGSRRQGMPAAAGRSGGAAKALIAPADTPRTINRRLAFITAVALLISILACAFTFRAFQGSAILPHFALGSHLPGIQPGPSPTANATATKTAHNETAQLQAATGGAPLFKDALIKNDNHWSTNGKTIFFASDGLHIRKMNDSSAIGVDAPVQPSKLQDVTRMAATVDISFTNGSPGDLAGMRFFVTTNDDGSQDYYAFLVSAEGRYELWLHRNRTWTFLRSGYSGVFKLGHGQTNTLAVLADSTKQEASLYANGQFISSVSLPDGALTSGNVGLIVLDSDVEAIFTNLAVYDAGV